VMTSVGPGHPEPPDQGGEEQRSSKAVSELFIYTLTGCTCSCFTVSVIKVNKIN